MAGIIPMSFLGYIFTNLNGELWSRWYLRRLRSLADKTDAGRLALPSILKAVETSILDGPGERSTAEIWSAVDAIFSVSFLNPPAKSP